MTPTYTPAHVLTHGGIGAGSLQIRSSKLSCHHRAGSCRPTRAFDPSPCGIQPLAGPMCFEPRASRISLSPPHTTKSALLSRSGGLRALDKLCVEPAGVSRRCMGVSVPLRLVPSPTGLPSKRGPGFGCFSRADQGTGGDRHVAPPTWLVSNFLVRPASS